MNAIRMYLKEMTLLMGNSAPVLVIVLAMGTLLGIMDLGCIVLLAKLVGAVSDGKAMVVLLPGRLEFPLLPTGLFLIVFYFCRAMLGIAFNYLIFYRTGQIEANLRANLMTQFMRMPYEQRLTYSVGSMLTAINQWTASFSRSVLAPFLRFVCDATVGMLILVYAVILYPLAVLAFLTFGVVLGVAYDRTLRRVSTSHAREFRKLSEEITENSQQALAGYKEIRVAGLAAFFCEHIRARSIRMGKALAVSITIGQSSRMIIEAILMMLGIGILLYISNSGHSITQQLPQLAILTFIVLRISAIVSLSTATVANLRLYRGVVRQLAEDCKQEIEPLPVLLETADFESLCARGLTFRYASADRAVISRLDLEIAHGDALAIVGPSGTGKTTLVDLLLGILHPSEGAIEVTCVQGGKRAQQTNLIGMVSYLSQHTYLINDTLRRNVAMGCADKEIDDARVIEALRKAKLGDFAHAKQLDEMIGDRGGMLSGGQRQRVALARAFYHGHRVMILDEATNAVDLTTEIEIIQDLLALRPEVTIITITHRPEIARLFPRVLNLEVLR